MATAGRIVVNPRPVQKVRPLLATDEWRWHFRRDPDSSEPDTTANRPGFLNNGPRRRHAPWPAEEAVSWKRWVTHGFESRSRGRGNECSSFTIPKERMECEENPTFL